MRVIRRPDGTRAAEPCDCRFEQRIATTAAARLDPTPLSALLLRQLRAAFHRSRFLALDGLTSRRAASLTGTR